MKYIGSYDRENQKWTPEPLPAWFVVLLMIVTVISLIALAVLPGPMG